MKYLILSDLHLREFWKDPVSKWDGNIIFLGDYVDPYPHEFPDGIPDPLIGLQEVFDFADTNRDRVTILIGNHKFIKFEEIICALNEKSLSETELIAGKPEMVISSQASYEDEGSSTIPEMEVESSDSKSSALNE